MSNTSLGLDHFDARARYGGACRVGNLTRNQSVSDGLSINRDARCN
jgi:hypothetical protein